MSQTTDMPSHKEALFLLRPADVAEVLGINRNTVYKWLRRGILTRVRIGGSTFVSGHELLRVIEGAGERAPVADPGLRRRARALLEEFRHRESRIAERRAS